MANSGMPGKTSTIKPESLKGWQQIAQFLGQPIAVAQRWRRSGMPVERVGRSVLASREDLNAWLGREVGGEPVHVATSETDLSVELKRGLAYLRKDRSLTASRVRTKS